MKILGLSLGQLTTAALMVDGKIVACASEERWTRNKNDMGYPKEAIDYCLREAGLSGKDLDAVAIGSLHIPADYQVTKVFSDFGSEDYLRAQKEYWYPRFYEGKSPRWIDVFKDKIDLEQYPGGWDKIDFTDDKTQWATYKPFIHETIVNHIGVDKQKIVHIDHHTAHAFYAYYASPLRGDTLIFTADAFGDGLSATISTVKNGVIERISESKTFNLGRLYRYVTELLAMKPNEHEYKVMGLAPYSKPYYSDKPYSIFKENLYVDGLEFKYHERPTDMFFYFRDKLEGCRFDGIAGGLQRYVEDMLVEWVENALRVTGLRKVVFGGGVGMNIKAMHKLGQLEGIDELFVPPSVGDESLAAGVCYKLMHEYCGEKGLDRSMIKHFDSAYLGPDVCETDVTALIEKHHLSDTYRVKRSVKAKEVAMMLRDGKVIGRCVGRMEFGARALGNRSILANPKYPNIVRKINEQIKNRDFWMPFTPSILEECTEEYLVNPKKFFAPYMTVGFDSTAKAQEDIPGGLHPADFTARPQMVTRSMNPEYHELITAFKKLTGVGALLNTSFNLHGYPIVMTPEDALHVFQHSDIDAILVGETLISKL
jgi:carbamoyltransferase